MQLEISLIISQIIAFLAMVWILKRFAWKPLLKMMEERRKKIESEFQDIEDQKKELQALIDDYSGKIKEIENTARLKIHEAVEERNKIVQKIQEEAYEQAKNILEKAKEDAKHEMEKAKTQLKKEMIHLVALATEKLLQEKIDAKKQEKLLDEFINKVD